MPPLQAGKSADNDRRSRALQLSACGRPDGVKVWSTGPAPQFPGLGPQDPGTGSCRAPVDQRSPVPAAGASHLPPVTVRTHNNRRVLIPFQLFRGDLQSVAYQCGDKEQRRKSCGRASARFTQHPPHPPTPPRSPFPSFNKSAPSHPTHAG